ncbi:hypothetical protein SJ219_22810, partial [Enterobacter hormaechei]|nr:hypothetical protein [Enterobacter hormaechei]
ADRNRSHWSTSKTPSYTKSVSWQHHRGYYRDKRYPYVIRFSYNISLPKRPNRATLIDQVGLNGTRGFRWSHFELTEEQFSKIIQLGHVNESFIVH